MARGIVVLVFLQMVLSCAEGADQRNSIRPWGENPRFWQYQGQPILLAGGSKDDSLFQLPDLKAHLDEMAKIGANYVRNTMSDRPLKGFEVYPFQQRPDGKYDLNQWNEEYWRRFENLLRWTAERAIFVQIEVWDRFDYSDHKEPLWTNHPYNPKNNVNYTSKESGLKTRYSQHPGSNENPFFFTVPELKNNRVVLPFQEAQVDKMLSYALDYGNVLYCIDNETRAPAAWGRYWAQRIRQRAAAAGATVEVTEMWDQWDPKGDEHRRTLDYPELYSFADMSQNNHNSGQRHWDNLQWVLGYVAKRPRPVNTVKIYGADTGTFGTTRDGLERFWRNLIGGAAGSRFHRPDSGLGLSDVAKPHIKSLRMLAGQFDLFHATPDVDSRGLRDRGPNEAYLTTSAQGQYALYFPNGGDVRLDLTAASGAYRTKWLDIAARRWTAWQPCQAGGGSRSRPPARVIGWHCWRGHRNRPTPRARGPWTDGNGEDWKLWSVPLHPVFWTVWVFTVMMNRLPGSCLLAANRRRNSPGNEMRQG